MRRFVIPTGVAGKSIEVYPGPGKTGTGNNPNPNSGPKPKAKVVTASPEEFVAVWEAAGSSEDVAKALGRSESAVRSRADFYRKRGVKLKVFPKKVGYVTPKLDVEFLNRIVDDVRHELSGGARGGSVADKGNK